MSTVMAFMDGSLSTITAIFAYGAAERTRLAIRPTVMKEFVFFAWGMAERALVISHTVT